LSQPDRHLLVVDDDDRIRDLLREFLARAGFRVTVAADAATASRLIDTLDFDLMVLDVMMPGEDGMAFARRLRARTDQPGRTPVLMLTARGEARDRIEGLTAGVDDYLAKPFEPQELLLRIEAILRRAGPRDMGPSSLSLGDCAFDIERGEPMDRVVGLEIGADDYLAKPFEPRELQARLRAILRRKGGAPNTEILRFGRLEIDKGARVVRLDGEERTITSHQFAILLVLAERAGRVLSRDALMDLLKGEKLEAFDRSVDVHVSRIRAAIEDDPKTPRRILTVRGAGYVFARDQDR
jgi:DNA-binding response OmpR family regulator